MPFTVERLQNEPIIVITWSDPPNAAKDMPESWKEIDRRIRPDESGVYTISDLRNLTIDFASIVSGMTLQQEQRPGAANDPRVHSILVGSGILWEIVSKGAKQFKRAGMELPLFATMEEALAHAREKIKSW